MQVEEQKKQVDAKVPKGAPRIKTDELQAKYSRRICEDLLKRKFFYIQSFEIYGGVAGFYDYGPLGSAFKSNVESLWRNHFVLEEDMLELNCTCLTLSDVLVASGHVEKFADFMVKDLKNGQCHRADKLIDEAIEKMLGKKGISEQEKARLEKIQKDCENYNAEQMNNCIKENNIKAPDTNNDLSEAVPFNLMFAAEIGPTGQLHGYLRPETAQGIFLNFRRLIEFNNGRMPFAGAQIGLGFRNEIHPKQGLLRVREFQMAEIEHFVDPQNKDHPKFSLVAKMKIPLLTAPEQERGGPVTTDLTMGDAVTNKVIGNETLAYFMARTYQFLCSVGINPVGIRFRQHRSNEMAHYASDCWDAEVECSYGWIEVAGHSDRSCFDLTRHAEKSKVELNAARLLDKPRTVKYIQTLITKNVIAKEYKKETKIVLDHLENLNDEQKETYLTAMEKDGHLSIQAEGQSFKITKEMIRFERKERIEQEEKFVPHVIEPSFGLGRIMYCAFEHCFKMRESDTNRTYFHFPALVAPYKCSILPLLNQPAFNEKTFEIRNILTAAGISSKVETSNVSVGKRYARVDECGIPYAFTIDHETIEKQTLTMRDIHTMNQVRMPISEICQVINSLVAGTSKWDDVVKKYGLVNQKDQE